MRLYKRLISAVLCTALLCVLAGCALPWQKEEPVDPAQALYGEWTADLSITAFTIASAEEWLGHDVSLAEYMPALSLCITLQLLPDGTWSQTIDTAALADAQQQAEAALALALSDLMQQQLGSAGYLNAPAEAAEGENTEAAAEAAPAAEPVSDADKTAALLQQTIGMTAEEYIASLSLQLVPQAEVLQAEFNAGGAWAADGSTLRLSSTAAAPQETAPGHSYLAGGGALVITGGEGSWPGFGTNWPLMFRAVIKTAPADENGGAAK